MELVFGIVSLGLPQTKSFKGAAFVFKIDATFVKNEQKPDAISFVLVLSLLSTRNVLAVEICSFVGKIFLIADQKRLGSLTESLRRS